MEEEIKKTEKNEVDKKMSLINEENESELNEEENNFENKSKKQKDAGFNFLIAQVTICMFAVLAVFILKFVGGNTLKVVETKYVKMFNNKTSVSEVVGAVGGVFNIKTSSTSSKPNTSSASSENLKSVNAPVSNSSSSSSESSSQTSVSSKTSSTLTPDNAGGNQNSDSAAKTSAKVAAGEGDVAGNEATNPFVFNFSTVQKQMSAEKISTNSMIVPVSDAILTSPFGFRNDPITGQYLFHKGVDLAAPTGTNIMSAMAGKVMEAGVSSSYGNYVMVNNGNGVSTMYAHCSKLIAVSGETVTQGQIIALVGMTGNATGPHCHFEVRINNICVNPQWLLPPLKSI